jgi:hypothetical protein
VPEGMNVEVAHHLSEHEHAGGHREGWHRIVEIIEVAVLAFVAIATAWSGLQAARWDSRQSLDYGEASRLRFEADAASTLGGQEVSADSAGFNVWLQAQIAGNTRLMDEISRRFTPDYGKAFEAWLKTDPFNNPNAPPGPGYMPGYVNPQMAKAKVLNEQASKRFDAGTEASETGDKYVRNTVLFASVLFLVAMAQRITGRGARFAANGIAIALLAYVTISMIGLPRL